MPKTQSAGLRFYVKIYTKSMFFRLDDGKMIVDYSIYYFNKSKYGR